MGICNVPLWEDRAPTEVHGTFVYYWGRNLVINEQYGDHEANVARWGNPTARYPATSEENGWAHPWTDQQTYRKVIIGSEIKPGTMEGWFSDLNQVTEIEGLDKIDTSECVSMRTLFYRCQVLPEIVGAENWNTSACTDMASVFHSAHLVNNSVDLLTNHWDTSNVEDFSGILCGQKAYTDLVVAWDMSKAKYARTSFGYMTETVTIDISGLSCPLLEDAPFMFGVNDKLTTIYSDGTFALPAGCTANNMFSNNYLIVGGNGTTYQGPSQEYARIDEPGTPGYFTRR